MKIAFISFASSLCLVARAQVAYAETIHCEAENVQCLIAAIHQANADSHKTTIRLAAGTYLLTAIDNDTNGPNGLPSIASRVRIEAAGGGATFARAMDGASSGSSTSNARAISH